MIFVMALALTTQSGLVYLIDSQTSKAQAAAIAAAVILFVYQAAFAIGFQATVWVYP
jgi:hypothetical protein